MAYAFGNLPADTPEPIRQQQHSLRGFAFGWDRRERALRGLSGSCPNLSERLGLYASHPCFRRGLASKLIKRHFDVFIFELSSENDRDKRW